MGIDEASPMCMRCSASILDGEPVTRQHGDWFHVRCRRIITTRDGARESQDVARYAREAVEDARRRIEEVRHALDPQREPPAVLCVICRAGIASVDELVMTSVGSMHPRCREDPPASST
jgi:hypothetical protein